MIRDFVPPGLPMPTNLAPPPLSAADYEAIEAAVMETARGRWFLVEYARRNRHADTEMLLGALERLENVIRNEAVLPTADRIRFGLVAMAKAITQTKAEIAAIKPHAAPGRIEEASEELDSVVQATESATSDILAAAERIQEIAWTLREQGHKPETCDLLDDQATDIYTACSFQDLTGQRTRKVIGVLRYLESRINAMIELWGCEPAAGGPPPLVPEPPQGDAALLNGPAKRGQGLVQADIDVVMGAAAEESPSSPDTVPPVANDADLDNEERVAANAAAPWRPGEIAAVSAGDTSHEPAPRNADPLAPFRAMSYVERVALFT
jgi:chemotaxis protein CheZ